MEQKKKQLEVGDVLLGESAHYPMTRVVIERVTAKRAYIKNGEFEREYLAGNMFRERGDSGYGSTYYKVATPELEAKYQEHKDPSNLRKSADTFIKLPIATVRALLDVLKNQNP